MTNYAAEIQNLKKSFSIQIKETLSKAFADFFKEHPETVALRFMGYTCYFNDGDPTYYSVENLEVQFKETPQIDFTCSRCQTAVDTSSKFCSSCGRKQPTPAERQEKLDWLCCYSVDGAALKTAMQSIETLLTGCEDSILMTFGDHKRIIVRSKSDGVVFSAEDYKDHH